MEYLVDIGELLMTIVLIGFLTESIVELLKTYFMNSKHSAVVIYTLSIVVGMVLAFALKVSLFTPDNKLAYYVGIVICGLISSRGANYVHNWLGQLPNKTKQ